MSFRYRTTERSTGCLGRNTVIQTAHRSGHLSQMLLHRLFAIVHMKRRPAGKQLIHRCPKSVDIRLGVGPASEDLFRSHVIASARYLGFGPDQTPKIKTGLDGNRKVYNRQFPAVVNQNIGWLNIAKDDWFRLVYLSRLRYPNMFIEGLKETVIFSTLS